MPPFSRRSPSSAFISSQPAPLLQPARLRSEPGRQHSQQGTSTSGREHSTACSAWLSPQDLNTSKLSVTFLPCASEEGPQLPSPRKYTLTHSDITGQLRLSVGQQYNQAQLSGWYLQLFRDEVLAEWLLDADGTPQLHLFCHISSDQGWSGPIPPALRSRVFQKEIPLVLKTLLHGDREYFSRAPQLLRSTVFLHLSSHVQALNMRMDWGILGDQKSWRQPEQGRWFELWWKRSQQAEAPAPPRAQPPPPQVLLEKAAAAQPVENCNGAAESSSSNGVVLPQDGRLKVEPSRSAASGAYDRAGGRADGGKDSNDRRSLEEAGVGRDGAGGRELELSRSGSRPFSSASYHRPDS